MAPDHPFPAMDRGPWRPWTAVGERRVPDPVVRPVVLTGDIAALSLTGVVVGQT